MGAAAKAPEKLSGEREQLLAFINANLPGTCVYRTIYHRDGRMECTYVSPTIEALIGVPAERFMEDAKRAFAFVHPEDMPAFRQNLANAVRTGSAAEFSVRVKHPSGRELWAQFRSQVAEQHPDGTQVRDGVVVDITSVKAAEAELRSVRQRLELALSVSRTCIWDDDLAANRIVIDPTWATMRGFPAAETVTTWRRLIAGAHPDDRSAIMAATRRAVHGETDEYRIEQRIATAEGGWIWIMSHGRVVTRDERGRATRMIGTNTDITARRQAEEQVGLLNANLEKLVAERTSALATSTAQLEKSERLFRNLVEDVNQGYFVADRRGLLTYCNPTVIAYAGFPLEQLLRKSVFRIVAEEDRPRVIAAYGEWLRQAVQDAKIEFRLARPGVRVVWVEQSSSFVRDAQGEVIEVRSSVRNITERKLAELALLAEKERTAIFAQLGRELAGADSPKAAAVQILGAAQKLLGWDSSWLHLWNEPQQKLEDLAEFFVVDGEIREGAPRAVALFEPTAAERRVIEEGPQLVLREAESDPGANAPLSEQGPRRLSLASVPIRVGSKLIGIFSIQSSRQRVYDRAGLDLLHTLASHCAGALVRLQNAAALRQSNDRFFAVFERSPIMIGLLSVPDGKLVEFNAAGIATFGYTREEAIGRTSTELNLWADTADRDRYLQELRTKGNVAGFEARMRRKNGEIFTVIYSGSLIEIDGKTYSLNSLQDISARRESEAALRSSEERLRLVWESVSDGMRLSDADGRIVAVNEGFCRIMAKPRAELVGRAMSECYDDANRARIEARYRERFGRRELPPETERRVTLWDGRERRLEVANKFIETDPSRPLLLGVFRDVTARRRDEEQNEKLQSRLFQTQKFEALGTLAGGVAHDFNNILTGVINYTMLAREDCPPSHPNIKRYLGEVLQCSDRAKELVRQILLVSRSQDAARVPMRLAVVVREALSLLRSTLPAGVEINSELGSGDSLIIGNGTQIHQVVMNLGINAAHAMQERGGFLTVRLRPIRVDVALAAELQDVGPGDCLCLEVADSGVGMDAAVSARIFEPFFTTKKVGEGTGLGLAVVRSVVRSHDGAIRVRSQVGVGTTFELFFPSPKVSRAPEPISVRGIARGKGERILLVDDEPMVIVSFQLMLERLGYELSIFLRPEEALQAFTQAPGAFDVMITDFHMPGMTGLELAKQMRAVRPAFPILVVSGFSASGATDQLRAEGVGKIIAKPINFTELASALAEALGRKSNNSPARA